MKFDQIRRLRDSIRSDTHHLNNAPLSPIQKRRLAESIEARKQELKELNKEKRENKRKNTAVVCYFDPFDCFYHFATDSGSHADKILTELLDKKKIKDQRGKLIFTYIDESKENQIEIVCFFRRRTYSRVFTTPSNKEAANMLLNKVQKKIYFECEGKLSFEF